MYLNQVPDYSSNIFAVLITALSKHYMMLHPAMKSARKWIELFNFVYTLKAPKFMGPLILPPYLITLHGFVKFT